MMALLAIQESGWDVATWSGILVGIGLLPFVFTMVTSFAKLVIVGGIVRQALGTPQVPPNSVIAGLAIVLTAHIMAPVAFTAYERFELMPESVEVEGGGTRPVATIERIAIAVELPLREFLVEHADPADVRLFESMMANANRGEASDSRAQLLSNPRVRMLTVQAPAFLLTELTEAFMIGFLLFVPFLVIDLAVSNLLLAMGMHMLSPTQISLPFKLLLFVMIDGWALLLRGLVQGYA
jgi:type III secretion protein R